MFGRKKGLKVDEKLIALGLALIERRLSNIQMILENMLDESMILGKQPPKKTTTKKKPK